MLKFAIGAALCAYEHHSRAKDSVISLNYSNNSKGTCFAISKSGLALGSFHTLEEIGATTVNGALIQVIDSDQENDLSLLQLPHSKEYAYLALGNSDSLVPGEIVYHFGFANGSLIGNKGYYQGKDNKYMYASTEMMHGQSGGPALNAGGEVIGICKGHLYCSPQRIKEDFFHSGPSLYIPVNTAKKFILKYCNFEEGEWKLKISVEE